MGESASCALTLLLVLLGYESVEYLRTESEAEASGCWGVSSSTSDSRTSSMPTSSHDWRACEECARSRVRVEVLQDGAYLSERADPLAGISLELNVRGRRAGVHAFIKLYSTALLNAHVMREVRDLLQLLREDVVSESTPPGQRCGDMVGVRGLAFTSADGVELQSLNDALRSASPGACDAPLRNVTLREVVARVLSS